MGDSPYELAFTLHGHSADVRNLFSPGNGVPLLLSASRDGSALVWGPPGGQSTDPAKAWDVKLRVEDADKRFVSCVGLVRQGGEAYLVMGSSSGLLTSFLLPSLGGNDPPEVTTPTHTLVEHKSNLCCLDTSAGGLIATGSWDKTVVVWKDWKSVIKIGGHQQAVWAVRFVGEDRLLTASADKTIVLHALDLASGTSHPLQTYTGHTDCVRGLSLRPDGKGFWSCGNDALVNIYSFDQPEPLRSLSGHTSFVYSVAALPGGGAISSGEDGTLRVWSETELVQTILHPSMSLWSSAVVPNASGYYLASSSADSAIRFFTKDPALMAPQSERDQWDKDISQRQLDKSQVGDVKRSDLPGMEALGREGKSDGQVMMIKNGENVEAYQWSVKDSTWQQIGQVVDAIGSGRKQLYEGQEWDFLFDVDVSEGMPPLKLPYNASGENPWVAAQRFLNKHELPQSYTEQVVEFIEKNAGGVQLGQGGGASNQYVDPYTGSSRYTGSSNTPSYGGGSDPFTGGSAYSTSAAPKTKVPGVLPVKTYLSFKTFNLAAAKAKITSLNDEFKAGSPALAFTTEEEQVIQAVYGTLGGKGEYDAQAFVEIMLRWPEAQRFPLVDIARVLAASSPAFGSLSNVPSTLLEACAWSTAWTATKPRETNTLLSLRALANLFLTASGRQAMAECAGGMLIELRREWAEVGARKMALATVALNYSILAVEGGLPSDHGADLLDLVLHILENETQDGETIYRTGVALGNLLSSKLAGGLAVGDVARGKGLMTTRASTSSEKRVKDLAQEVESLS